MMTAMAFLVFAEHKVDLAILETGLGGRLDSTNVVEPTLSIITTIALDHCSILGHSIEEIAREKAGIIKQGVPVLTGWLPDAANLVVEALAGSKSSPFESMAYKGGIEFPDTNLVGRHQKRNAALAYCSVLKIEKIFPVTEEKIRKGLTKVRLEGRWQYLEGSPVMILDACHNQEGAVALQENLRDYGKSVIVWLGALGEDRAVEVINAVVPFAEEIRLFEIKQPRACSISSLKKLVPENFKGIVSEGTCENFTQQVNEVNKASTIVITGSIYLVGDLLSQIRESSYPLGHTFQDLL
jgi:dihydrofolate synthase/folylpolyglutamate synthase